MHDETGLGIVSCILCAFILQSLRRQQGIALKRLSGNKSVAEGTLIVVYTVWAPGDLSPSFWVRGGGENSGRFP